ncbi:FusB/FusC family EF-G-binding protein [Secundilactobacillus kimchicus]|uniref:FusB/FusC family EF-G-binding protein n=1 Tax=Secundilactobacillus kimchicus TaxID=528209 RepID=UPI0024A7B1F0|nr:FusB/FusC family EF-G-binding protein [Secundilactobacillus kimchicus]
MKPFEFTVLKNGVARLVAGYSANLDPVILDVLKADAIDLEKTFLIADDALTTNFIFELTNRRLTVEQATAALTTLRPQVTGFPSVTPATLATLFKKSHHLVEPDWQRLDLKMLTYLGWNDIATHQKFIVAVQADRLVGVRGTLSAGIHNGVCAICQTMSRVSMFTATTATNHVGNYRTNGNYICRDSGQCNRQLTSDEGLQAFLETVHPQ